MRQRYEGKAFEDTLRLEVNQLKETNAELDRQKQDLLRKLAGADPKIMKEQRELINDLKNKVIILERELKAVQETTEKDIERYKSEYENLLAQRQDEQFNKDMKEHVDKVTL